MPSDGERLAALLQEAVAAHRRGDLAAAEQRYREVLRRNPREADATHFLGLIAHQTGHPEAALALLTRSLELGPGSALYRYNLGGVYRELGRSAEAERSYREALALRPEYADALVGLALLHAGQGRLQEALSHCDRALACERGHFEAWMQRAAVLAELLRRAEALAAYREAEALAATDSGRLQRVGLALREFGALPEALACFERALALAPGSPELHNSLGAALADRGELAEAERHYREALRLKPDYAGAWHNLATIGRLGPGDPLWPELTALAARMADLPESEALLLHFALGKLWEDRGDYPRAFHHYLEGNRLKRAALHYDEARQADFFREFIVRFDAGFIARHAAAGCASEQPVFIVGMPRSGTTLVEQILASHPQVHGGGELQMLRQCLRLEFGPVDDAEFPARLATASGETFRRIGERYAEALAALAPGAARITDKLPGNMALVGLIRLALPRARIIHCRRDPLDTCFSCYSKLFTTGHAFSYELGELGRFYRRYEELMAHWRAVLPAQHMLELRYEELVTDLEREARRLVAFCGLPWDAACLRFYENARTVKTASLAQVRRPLYTASVGRWRRFEPYLGPLQRALAGD